jgi:site-specific recombinase XerD
MTLTIQYFRAKPNDIPPLSSGPLAPHIASFAALLARQRYCRHIAQRKLRLIVHLNRWLSRKRIPLAQVDETHVTAFLKARRKIQRPANGDSRTLSVLLHYLRTTGVTPVAQFRTARSHLDQLVQDYEHFLIDQRSFVAGSVAIYGSVARRFLKHRFPDGKIRLRELRAEDLTGFVQGTNSDHRLRSPRSAMSPLRSFLRFLLQRGQITIPLANAVPTMAARHSCELPKYLEPAQVEKILKSCDRRRQLGRRDYAILLLLARLGLRAGEVAQLCLEDIDWPAGELCVHGKRARLDRLPLPEDVGRAIADYLKTRHPSVSSRRVFLCANAPYEDFANRQTVGAIVKRALNRARLFPPHRGAHLLRHSLATTMLRRGATMVQIGQVLRHQQIQTTEIYAKVDVNTLRTLAQPWPGGAR